MNNLIAPLRAAVNAILTNPGGFDWSVQGFGMMRCYFDEEKVWRLNIWDSALSVPNVSTIHDHPWDFTSWIIAGEFINIRYHETPQQPTTDGGAFEWQTIQTGPGGGPDGSRGQSWLAPLGREHYSAGDTYCQNAEEVHQSLYADGTVTLNHRIRRPDGEHARVFWPVGEQWVDAEPRAATLEEIASTISIARMVMETP